MFGIERFITKLTLRYHLSYHYIIIYLIIYLIIYRFNRSFIRFLRCNMQIKNSTDPVLIFAC